MKTNLTVEQTKNIKWFESTWNQSGKSMEEKICRRAKS